MTSTRCWWIIGLFAIPALTGCGASQWQRFEYTHAQMGTQFRAVLYAGEESTASAAAEAAFDRVDELNAILSDYEPESELSQLSETAGREQRVPVSDELWAVLSAAQKWSRRSGGAFDVTVGPVVRLWRRARKFGEMPNEPRLRDARQRVGYRMMKLHPEQQAVTLEREGMRLDLGGIAKGYAADEALKVIERHGVSRALIDAGGDVRLGDPPPDRSGWRVELRPMVAEVSSRSGDEADEDADHTSNEDEKRRPGADGSSDEENPKADRKLLSAHNRAVATSGDVFQHIVIDGTRYSHIVNPKTGLGLTPPIGVSIIADDGMTADALASAVSVLGPEKGIELVNQTPGAAAIVVRRTKDGELKTYRSKRFGELEFVRP